VSGPIVSPDIGAMRAVAKRQNVTLLEFSIASALTMRSTVQQVERHQESIHPDGAERHPMRPSFGGPSARGGSSH
jgi:hypothetical protein